MTKINLLPDSFRVKSSVVKTAELIKKIYIIVFVVIFVVVATSIGLFYMYRVRIKESEERQGTLKRQIKALEETEQRLILVKDRLEKVEQISKAKSAGKGLEGFMFVMDGLDAYVFMDQVDVNEKTLDIKLRSDSTVSTLEFLEFIKNSGEFSHMSVKGMNYSLKSGFGTEVILSKK